MPIAHRIHQLLDHLAIPYEVVEHPYSATALESCRDMELPAELFAKAILLRDKQQRHLLAVLPCIGQIDLEQLNQRLGRQLTLAHEHELAECFPDCAPGAVPPLGMAYGIPIYWDEALALCSDIYLEAGDHRQWLHLSQRSLLQLIKQQPDTTIGWVPARNGDIGQ